MEWFYALIIGIVEGITEFLPISSTGHLLILEHALGIRKSDLFNVVIQCGAVVAVLPLFPDRLRQVFYGWREPEARDFIIKLAAAFAITGVGGVILEKFDFKLPDETMPIAMALIVGGVLFLAMEWWLENKEPSDDLTWTVVVAVGVGQLIAAVFPGTSRSGSTILLMLALGMSRPAATEFSFLVGIPTMLAAGSLKIFKALHRPPPGSVPEDWLLLLWCTVVSAVVSFIAVKWLLRYIQTHTFIGFGWYRILAGALLLFWAAE
ncbi:MAG: undecaprenyl-diphosphate phosphatase [Verrucomicrobia bacterium]|nr:undecaprenyl-diphosphate phosphatase [Verrucomicrobiota bacterium]